MTQRVRLPIAAALSGNSKSSTLGLQVKLSLGKTSALHMSCDLQRPAGAGGLGVPVFESKRHHADCNARRVHCCDSGEARMSAPI